MISTTGNFFAYLLIGGADEWNCQVGERCGDEEWHQGPKDARGVSLAESGCGRAIEKGKSFVGIILRSCLPVRKSLVRHSDCNASKLL
jgi:hypothetical protein